MSRGHTLGFKLQKTSFSQNGNPRFLTHDRDLGAKMGGKWSYGRSASFWVCQNHQKSRKSSPNHQKSQNLVLIKIYGWQFGQNLAWNGSPWLGLGWKWVEMNPTRSRNISKPDLWLNLLIEITFFVKLIMSRVVGLPRRVRTRFL